MAEDGARHLDESIEAKNAVRREAEHRELSADEIAALTDMKRTNLIAAAVDAVGEITSSTVQGAARELEGKLRKKGTPIKRS